MNMRQTLILVAVFLLGVLTAGALIGRPGAAEPKVAAPGGGRYQISKSGTETVMLDTMTGQCWEYTAAPSVVRGWTEMGSPVKAK